ncbi:MAG: hypothetical protein ACLR1D_05535 [Dialister sp.]
MFNALANKLYYHGDPKLLTAYLTVKDNVFVGDEKIMDKNGEVIGHGRSFMANFNSKTGQGYYYYEAP